MSASMHPAAESAADTDRKRRAAVIQSVLAYGATWNPRAAEVKEVRSFRLTDVDVQPGSIVIGRGPEGDVFHVAGLVMLERPCRLASGQMSIETVDLPVRVDGVLANGEASVRMFDVDTALVALEADASSVRV